MASRHAIETGDGYREVAPGIFGAPGLIWIVEDLFVGTDGIEHARLASALDRTQRKTLSLIVLSDRRRFTRVEREK
jgi:hypothetical protein